MRGKVLIVDDVYFMRNLLKKELKEAGFETIIEAKNGKEALRLYFEHNPDLVTMDIKMPDMTGIEVTKQILEKDPKAKILAISGSTDIEIKQEILRAGALDYLSKPFQPSFLWNKIDAILKPKHLEQIESANEDLESIELVIETNKDYNSTTDSIDDLFDEGDSYTEGKRIVRYKTGEAEDSESEALEDILFELPTAPDPVKSEEIKIETEFSHIEFTEEYTVEIQEETEVFMLIADTSKHSFEGNMKEDSGSMQQTILVGGDNSDDFMFSLDKFPSQNKSEVKILKPSFSEDTIPEPIKEEKPITISIRPPRRKFPNDNNAQDFLDNDEDFVINTYESGKKTNERKSILGSIKGLFKG